MTLMRIQPGMAVTSVSASKRILDLLETIQSGTKNSEMSETAKRTIQCMGSVNVNHTAVCLNHWLTWYVVK